MKTVNLHKLTVFTWQATTVIATMNFFSAMKSRKRNGLRECRTQYRDHGPPYQRCSRFRRTQLPCHQNLAPPE